MCKVRKTLLPNHALILKQVLFILYQIKCQNFISIEKALFCFQCKTISKTNWKSFHVDIFRSYIQTLSLSLSYTHTHPLSLSLSVSLSHTHTWRRFGHFTHKGQIATTFWLAIELWKLIHILWWSNSFWGIQKLGNFRIKIKIFNSLKLTNRSVLEKLISINQVHYFWMEDFY